MKFMFKPLRPLLAPFWFFGDSKYDMSFYFDIGELIESFNKLGSFSVYRNSSSRSKSDFLESTFSDPTSSGIKSYGAM